MTIPEDTITQHLDTLLTSSEPGATMHHLHVIAAPTGAVGPLGLPDEKQLDVTIYAIAPTEDVSVEEFIGKVVMAAAAEAHDKGTRVLFAGLSQEAYTVSPMDDLGLRLVREGRLSEHPDAAEVTIVYAAAADGRRWRGRRWLTGPRAGTAEPIEVLAGRPQPGEGQGVTAAPLIRRLVGRP